MTRHPALDSRATVLGVDGAALSGLAALAGSDRDRFRSIADRLDRRVTAVVLGADRATPTLVDTIQTAAVLGAATARTGLLPAVVPADTAPVNVARALATLHHHTDRRAGVLLVPSGPTWSAAVPVPFADDGGPGDTLVDERDLAAGTAAALAGLWESWPLDALVGDSATGEFVRPGGIVRVEVPGPLRVRGPLTLPTDTADRPVVAAPAEVAERADAAVDLLLTAGGVVRAEDLDGLEALLATLPDRPVDGVIGLRHTLGLGPSRPVATSAVPAYPVVGAG